uniref:Gastrin/cholecystokinin-like peptide n=1 Tax=Panagrellus redivivus TaxID=6233 RepID=A0A7E4VVH5_PANRE
MAMLSISWIMLGCFLLATVFSAVYGVPVGSSSDNGGHRLPVVPLGWLIPHEPQVVGTWLPEANRLRRAGPIPFKERRASADTFDMWEGMMDSLDTLQKPRFGR